VPGTVVVIAATVRSKVGAGCIAAVDTSALVQL
jgi:hypothetical protein